MRRPTPIILSLLLLAGTTGCATPGTSPKPTAPGATTSHPGAFLAGYSTADNQYRHIQIGLTLPKGVTFPKHLPNTSDHYPPNAGTVTAQNYWLCAWMLAYLKSTPSPKNQALQQLPKYLRMDTYAKALDARGRSSVDTAIRDARKGTRKTVATFTQSSCNGPFYSRAH